MKLNLVTSNKNEPIVSIMNTFLLRGVDPKVIIDKYVSGAFFDLCLPQNKTQLSEAFTNCDRVIGKNISSECYQFNDKIGTRRTIITTNHTMYIWVKHGQDINSISEVTSDMLQPPHKYCRWCRRKIKRENTQNGVPLGIPLKMVVDVEGDLYFYVEDAFDTFRCCFSELRRYKNANRKYHHPSYANAEALLDLMYKRAFPDDATRQPLRELDDWRLLETNDGPLSEKEYFGDAYYYSEINTLVFLPAKRQYMKMPNL